MTVHPCSYNRFKFIVKIIFFSHGVRLSPLHTAATIWPIVPGPDDRWWLWSNWWNVNWHGKPKYSEKTSPSATLFTTNPTWPDSDLNLGHCGGKPATNRLSYGTAGIVKINLINWKIKYIEHNHNLLWNKTKRIHWMSFMLYSVGPAQKRLHTSGSKWFTIISH
jgi:hypothetical protein